MECPACGYEFIPGEDLCGSCKQDLTSTSLPQPLKGRLRALILEDPISQLNAPQPICLRSSEPVVKAIELMRKRRFGSVVAVDGEGRIEGIYTERDALRRALPRGRSGHEVPLAEMISRSPQVLREEDTIAHALNKMAMGGCRHVPIVRDGRPVGYVSIRGILSYIAKNAL